MINAILISSSLSQNLWKEAILSSNYVLNKIPYKKTNKTPHELWKCHKPSNKYLKAWRCLAEGAISDPKRVKIWPKTIDCVFIEYTNNSSVYRFLVHNSENPYIHVHIVMESRSAYFFEDVFWCNSTQELNTSQKEYDTRSMTLLYAMTKIKKRKRMLNLDVANKLERSSLLNQNF